MNLEEIIHTDFSQYSEKEKTKTHEEVKKDCENCKKCDLSKTRTNIVFNAGNPTSPIMLIGEAPGKNEDEQGSPFVGRSGKLLDEILLKFGISRDINLYICNTVKCRPPENRVPTKQEKELCKNYLDAQIAIIKPKVILLCGATAVKSMIDAPPAISKIRGQWFDGPYNIKMMPIFHPSYLLRNHSMEEGKPRKLFHDDIKKVKDFLK